MGGSRGRCGRNGRPVVPARHGNNWGRPGNAGCLVEGGAARGTTRPEASTCADDREPPSRR